jgi:hypothetical protein
MANVHVRKFTASDSCFFTATCEGASPEKTRLRFLEIALVLVRLDHIASFIVNANHSIM